MGKIKVGINGYGRIARCILRIVEMRETNIEVVGINVHSADTARMAYQFKYDSVFGRFMGEIEALDDALVINGNEIKIFSGHSPAEINWSDCGAEYVIESTGRFLTRADCAGHLGGTVRKVVITAPAKDDTIPFFVMGVNNETYDNSMDIVSNASCTTNCLAPLAKVVNDAFGIERALMTTVHASTSKQKTVDCNGGKDWRAGRSVYSNIIPSTTGAAKAVGKVIPELKGKMTGMSMRIPAPDCSVVDLTCELKTPTTYEAICEAVKAAAEGPMKGIIEYNTDELVSMDVRGNFNTSIFDAKAGIMLDDTFVKLIAWYDNEWGYSTKVIELAEYMASQE